MNGKKIKLNDYKFTYGQETIYLNVIGFFKHQNGNKYLIYSYDNDSKLHYGVAHPRNKEIVIMTAKTDIKEIIKSYLATLLEGSENKKIESLSLKEIESIQIIDDYTYDEPVDIPKLIDLTIPKPKAKEEEKKTNTIIAVAPIFFALFIFVVAAFFIINPQIFIGDDEKYVCIKTYPHEKLPANVIDTETVTFNGKGELIRYDKYVDNIFTDIEYYRNFKLGEFYKYLSAQGYKFLDETYTFRLLYENSIDENFKLSKDKTNLLDYYNDNGYSCEEVELDND